MSGFDQYYTNDVLAKKLLEYRIGKDEPKVIADFAAGQGALLDIARIKWNNATYIANDICKANYRYLRNKKLFLATGCDFRNSDSHKRSTTLKRYRGKCDLVLLNPPFSNRGGGSYEVNWKGNVLRCSQAVLFVVNALSYLSCKGEILAILPEGALFSDRNSDLWKEINRDWSVKYRKVLDRNTPSGWNASVYTVSCKKREKNVNLTISRKVPKILGLDGLRIQVRRGNIDVTRREVINGHGSKLIHTTDIVERSVSLKSIKRFVCSKSIVCAPSVVVARVCNPRSEKYALISKGRGYCLSDCVFGLEFENHRDAETFYSALQMNWSKFSKLYGGSCAKYLTKDKLVKYLERCGCVVESI